MLTLCVVDLNVWLGNLAACEILLRPLKGDFRCPSDKMSPVLNEYLTVQWFLNARMRPSISFLNDFEHIARVIAVNIPYFLRLGGQLRLAGYQSHQN